MTSDETTRIEGAMVGRIDAKRFYAPGVALLSQCPACGAPYREDFGDNYLMYPEVGRPFESTNVCRRDECGHEWKVTLRVDVVFSVVGDETKR